MRLTFLFVALLFSSSAFAQPIGGPAVVASIKNDLVNRGIIPAAQTDNCHAFQITARVAWATRDQGAKLIVKNPAQNGCTFNGVRYSHDAISYPGGFLDVLRSAGPPANTNAPGWDWSASGPCANCADPFDLDPAPVVVVPPPPPPPAPVVDDVLKLRVEAAERQVAELSAKIAAMLASMPTGCRASASVFGIRFSASCELVK